MPDQDTAFCGWANEQAAPLRAGRLIEADVANTAQEIDSVGRGGKRELVNRLAVQLQHLPKWQVQPALRGTFWRLAIEEQRSRLHDHMADSPSLRPRLPEAVANGCKLALPSAQRETGMARAASPPACPWTPAQIMADDFHPA